MGLCPPPSAASAPPLLTCSANPCSDVPRTRFFWNALPAPARGSSFRRPQSDTPGHFLSCPLPVPPEQRICTPLLQHWNPRPVLASPWEGHITNKHVSRWDLHSTLQKGTGQVRAVGGAENAQNRDTSGAEEVHLLMCQYNEHLELTSTGLLLHPCHETILT